MYLTNIIICDLTTLYIIRLNGIRHSFTVNLQKLQVEVLYLIKLNICTRTISDLIGFFGSRLLLHTRRHLSLLMITYHSPCQNAATSEFTQHDYKANELATPTK